MKIKVNWMDGWANNPTFEISEARMLKNNEELYWEKRNTLHRRNQGTHVQYFHSDGKPREGYGGRIFEGKLLDGTPFSYKGAWSSRASCVNALWPDDPIVDVHWGHIATAIRVAHLVDWWVANQPSWGLAVVDDQDAGPIVLPTTKMGVPKNPRAAASSANWTSTTNWRSWRRSSED